MEKVSFRFKFSPLVLVLIVIVLGLLTTGIVLNIINFWGYDTLDTITYILTGVMDLALLVATIAFIVNSKYVITKDYLLVRQFGSAKKYPVSSVLEIARFKLSNKLVLRFTNGEYTVIIIDSKNYQRFIDVLRGFNNQIIYTEEQGEDKI